MRLTVNSNEGHYNWANFSEKSIMTYICIYDDNNKISRKLNTSTSDFITDNDPDYIADLIEEEQKRYLFSSNTKNCLEMAEFIRANNLDILLGNKSYELQKKQVKVLELQKDIDGLRESIKHLEEEKQNVNVL